MTVPEPGWYIDPEDARHVRWWSGESWTEHKSPNPQYPPAATPAVIELEEPHYVPMASYYGAEAGAGAGTGTGTGTAKLTHREKDRQIRRNNSFAYTGCVLSLVAFLVNPFAILSILGIVFSAIGLAKSHDLDGRRRVTGRGTAIAGIVLGLVGLAAFAWVLAKRAV
jgi:hypothetical protein